MNRAELFNIYLTSEKQYITYNGVVYTLLNENNEIVTQTNTNDEMLNYIKGFMEAINKLTPEIKELENLKTQNKALILQNELNVKNYEKIIFDMGGESMEKALEKLEGPKESEESERLIDLTKTLQTPQKT